MSLPLYTLLLLWGLLGGGKLPLFMAFTLILLMMMVMPLLLLLTLLSTL